MQTRPHRFAAATFVAALVIGFAACSNSNGGSEAGAGKSGEAGKATAGTAGNSSGASSSGGSANEGGSAPEPQAGAGVNEPAGGTDQGVGGEATAGAAPGAGGGDDGPPHAEGAECNIDDDCQVFNDCCECDVGPKTEEHPECEKLCVQSACSARQIQAPAICRSHRCVFDLNCNHADVTCDEAAPECPAGQTASIDGNCWGPCIDVAQCREVTECEACPAGTLCVENGDSPGFFTQCVEVSSSCEATPTCECADACSFSCGDDNGIACFCVVC